MVRITTLEWHARELISPSKIEDRPFLFATAAFENPNAAVLFCETCHAPDQASFSSNF
jgi:hypothetical protein